MNFNVFWEAWEVLASPRQAQDGPRWVQDGPRGAQDGPRWRQDGPRWRQDGPKTAQDGTKTVLRRVKMHPSGLNFQRCRDLQKYWKNQGISTFFGRPRRFSRPKTAHTCRIWPRNVQHGTARAASERAQRATRAERCRCS